MIEFERGNVPQASKQSEVDSIRKFRGLEQARHLPDYLEASWKRCFEDYNLKPDAVPRAEILTHSQLREITSEREEFLRIAEPEMERLFLRLVDSEYLVSIASDKGAMLLFRCDYQYLGDLAELGVLPGSIWTEERQGTNGVGTCLRVGKSLAIVGDQHYGAATQALTCLTAPIFGKNGTIESVINVTTARSGDERMNMVVKDIVERSASRIENRYFGRVHRDSHLLRVLENADNPDIADEGRLALDANGRIIDGSSRAVHLLNMPTTELVGAQAADIFDFETDLTNIRPDQPVTLNYKGRRLQVLLSSPSARSQHRQISVMPAERLDRRLPSVRIMDKPQKELRMDPPLAQSIDRAARLLETGLPLMLTGETGVGKTTFAQKIARGYVGETGQVISIDCSAWDRDVDMNSLMYALSHQSRSCLLFDRIDELDDAEQKSVLRVLEYVGQNESSAFGVIVMSGNELDTLSTSDRMRKDLLHRLKGGHVQFEPLRSSPDLKGTIKDFFDIVCKELNKPNLKLDDQVERVFESYHWPGNIRELRHTLRHAVALAENNVVRLDHLPADIVQEFANQDLTARSQSEASKIEAALRYNNGNVSMTARYLGVSRATLYRKIEIQKARSEQ